MTENEARYIVRMIDAYGSNVLFMDATDQDSDEIDRMKERYHEAGGWQKGREAALAEFILRVAENGVLGGEYLSPEKDDFDFYVNRTKMILIERPVTAAQEQPT